MTPNDPTKTHTSTQPPTNAKTVVIAFTLVLLGVVAALFLFPYVHERAQVVAAKKVAVQVAVAEREQCHSNLLKIEAAMLNWGHITHATSNAIPDSYDLSIYDTNKLENAVLRCPSDGKYTIGERHKNPTCTRHGDPIEETGYKP